ncbi:MULTISPECIES: DUF6893 family small protein [unclassified Rhodococcus (in: high G+C Gram-positive bacteria)]|nr:hypothetical protein DEU38_13217 [Rhodococcus sp. AG1013]
MRAVGMFSTVLFAAVAAAGAWIAVRSIPDMQRYLRMRRM